MKRLLPPLCAILMLTGELGAVTVSGRINFVTKRGQRPSANETLVWLEPIGAKALVKNTPGAFQMITRSKTLMPHVIAVPAGSTVAFPNEDPISHNLFSLSGSNAFDLGLYRRGPGKVQKFTAPGVVNVYCNVHPNMSAVIHVMPTPYYANADINGDYTLDVPPGKYRLVAWNEQGGTTASMIDVAAGGVTGNLALTIDSRTFRVMQHANKEGKAYQAPSSREY